jgi:glucokinase
VDARIRELNKANPESALSRLAAGVKRGEARFLAQAATQGDSGAVRVLDELAEDLAFGLSHVVHLFHPAVIAIGGGLSGIGEPLRCRVQEALSHFVMEAFLPGPEVCLAGLGEDAVPIGALELAKAPQG